MAEPSTIARPYAEAAFRLADEAGKLADWSAMLDALARVSEDARIRDAVDSPNVSAAQAAGVFIGVLTGSLTAEADNLVRVLAEYRRLHLLPEIAAQYHVLRNEREGVLEARITSAFPLSDVQRDDLVASLARRSGKRVNATVEVDPDLIAGVRVSMGDKVIDGSARAQLAALEAALKR